MATVGVLFLVLACAAGGVATYRGLDIRKWSDWLFLMPVFLCGIGVDRWLFEKSFPDIFGTGMVLAVAVIYSGEMVRRHRQRFGGGR